ncbi:MAG: hypothetical protein AB7H92_14035 [Microbacteriaceae bacterium]
MAKYTGLAMTVTLDDSGGSGVNITNDVSTITHKTSRGEQDVTGADKSAMERLQLLEDSEFTLGNNGFPSSTTRAVFENMANTRTLVLDYPDSATATIETYIFDYSINRGQDGGLSWSATLKLANGTKLAWS